MKTLKKFSAFLLTFVMMISLISVFNLTLNAKSFICGDYTYEILNKTDKTCRIIKYIGSDKEIIIPSKLDEYTVTEIGYDSFSNCEYITSFSIPASIKTIDEFVFEECYGLTSITVDKLNTAYSTKDGVLFNKDKTIIVKYPNNKSNTAYTIPNTVHTIGVGAFENCLRLKSVTIPDSVKSIEYGAFTFYYNEIKEGAVSPLKTVKIGKGLQNIAEEAFIGCTSITAITFPESLLSIGEAAFFLCSSLSEIFIPSKLETIGAGAFGACTSLKSIKVSSKNPSFTSVDGVLFNKDKTNIYIYPSGKTNSTYSIPYGVNNIGEAAFFYCKSLKSITIPLSVKRIEFGAFESCTSITSITIPESVQFIGDMTFYECSSLTSVIIPESVKVILNNAFDECPNLTIYGLKNSSAENYANANNIPFVAIKIENGDVNGDGKITLNDAMLIINDVAKKAPLHELFKTRADVDSDGNITLNDAMYIINFVAKKSDTVFPNK